MSFPAPSDGTIATTLDLNHLVQHPAATFFMRVSGTGMVAAGIHDGDLLIIDRSLSPVAGRLVVAALAGELVVRRLHQVKEQWQLTQPGKLAPISEEFEIWGVVTTVIHSV